MSTTGARGSAPAIDLTGDAQDAWPRRSYGQFWLYPGADFASRLNPNAHDVVPTATAGRPISTATASSIRAKQGALLAVQGGPASTAFDPEPREHLYVTRSRPISSAKWRRTSASAPGSSGTAGARCADRSTSNRPLDAYTVPVTIRRSRARRARSARRDDGATLTGYNLAPPTLALPHREHHARTCPTPTATTTPGSSPRPGARARRWSLLASFADTWRSETALVGGRGVHAELRSSTPTTAAERLQDVAGQAQRDGQAAAAMSA